MTSPDVDTKIVSTWRDNGWIQRTILAVDKILICTAIGRLEDARRKKWMTILKLVLTVEACCSCCSPTSAYASDDAAAAAAEASSCSSCRRREEEEAREEERLVI